MNFRKIKRILYVISVMTSLLFFSIIVGYGFNVYLGVALVVSMLCALIWGTLYSLADWTYRREKRTEELTEVICAALAEKIRGERPEELENE